MKDKKILIVDDDPDIVKSLTTILENQQYTVVSASCKEDGYTMLKSEKPDLLVLDVMMDTMSTGFDMANEIRKMEGFKKLPIVMLTSIDEITGVNFKSAFGQTEMIPVNAYINKPDAPHLLLGEINKLLSEK
jgi:CheY-like chemotaxis protein